MGGLLTLKWSKNEQVNQMKQRIVDSIKEDWCIQTCQFEYWSHIKKSFIVWHLAAFIGSLLLCFFARYLGLLSVPCLISWDYLALFDKKYRIYKDGYRPQRYEYIGTIWATLVACSVIIGLIIAWTYGESSK